MIQDKNHNTTFNFTINLDSSLLKRERIPIIIVGLAAFIIWHVFYPAFMSPDSIGQYKQALTGEYDDIHPPLMAKVLHFFMLMGSGIGAVTLAQTLLGCFGIYLLSRQILVFFNVNEKICTWFPLALLLFFISPITPLPFFLMVFWKDTWAALGFIWLAYLTLRILQIKKEKLQTPNFLYFLLTLCMIMVVLVRHNTIVLAPVFILILYFLARNSGSRLRTILLYAYPIFLYLIISHNINDATDVKKFHAEKQIYALESLGALVDNLDNMVYLPYMYSHLTPNYKKAYMPGVVDPILWYGKVKAVDNTFDIDNKALADQYYAFAKKDPFTLIKIKWEAFATMIVLFNKKYFFQPEIYPNSYGLAFNEKYKMLRNSWLTVAENNFYDNNGKTTTRFCIDEHLVWIIVNFLVLLFFFRRSRLANPILLLLLLIPIGYDASYLLATPANDFRYMYPSTLLMQIITFTLVIGFIANKVPALSKSKP